MIFISLYLCKDSSASFLLIFIPSLDVLLLFRPYYLMYTCIITVPTLCLVYVYTILYKGVVTVPEYVFRVYSHFVL